MIGIVRVALVALATDRPGKRAARGTARSMPHAADDKLPDRFFDEPISDGPKEGRSLDRAAFAKVIRTYYQMMGWDVQGAPLPATLHDHHLEWTLEPNGKGPQPHARP